MFSKLTKSQIIILIVFVLFLVIEIVLFSMGYLIFDASPEKVVDSDNEEETVTTTDPNVAPEISNEVDEEATSTEADVSVDIQNDSGESSGSKVGIFSVSASNSGFNPSSLVVTQGDVLQIEFSSDEDIDFFISAYGVHLSDSEGNRQTSFNASAKGTFRIECRDSCPSNGKIYGELLVKSKQ